MKLRPAALFALALLAAIPAARAAWSPFGTYWNNVARAAQKDDPSQVQSLISGGKSPNQTDDSLRTGLHFAAMNGSLQIAAILIRAGADLNVKDQLGDTPLHLAVERDQPEVAKLLLEAGARVDPQNKEGMTPLMIAARGGEIDLVRLLLSGGADASKTDYTGRDAAGWAEDARNAAVKRALQHALAARRR